MVNGERLRSQRVIGLPFTVHCLPKVLSSALSALPFATSLFFPLTKKRVDRIRRGARVKCRGSSVGRAVD